jgi:rubrerythrin
MNDMSSSASKKLFLEVCMGIEKLCADVYYGYSKLYEDIPEAASLWVKTALEEENHQRQFEMALRMIDDIVFEVPKANLERAYSIQFKLLKLLNHLSEVKPELHVAVSKAIEMEEKLSDLHLHTSVKFTDVSLQSLFKTLGEADRDHVSALQQFQTILSLPISEMNG